MFLIDRLLDSARVRGVIWKFWYPFLTRRLRGEEVLFLNYAFEENPPRHLPLDLADEVNRACIQLYHHVATQIELRGKKILEVSCGHGGGAAWLTRTLQPASYTGLDLNPRGIEFCRQRHHVDGLTFVQGDAQNLPFSDGTFDAVINVEASHCYPEFSRFISEVARVLKPGGALLYADFRHRPEQAAWEHDLAAPPFTVRRQREINNEVIGGMERNSARSLALIQQRLPKFLHGFGRDFAGVKGSRIHTSLLERELSYRSYLLEKSA